MNFTMTPEQQAAHERLLSMLPIRTHSDEPERWDAENRELSPDELPYLHALEEQ